MPYTETVEHTTETYNGREYPVTITRRRGVHTHVDSLGEHLVESATITDAGPKLGVSTCYTLFREYTQEEREAGRQKISEIVHQIMYRHGLW